jgi:putative transposase
MYFRGLSINQIRAVLNDRYGNYPSTKTVYGWITKYTREAVRQFKDYHPSIGDTWAIYGTPLKLSGVSYYCLDIFDLQSGYLLAAMVSANCEIPKIKELIEKARGQAGKTPSRILTARREFLVSIQSAYAEDSGFVVSGPICAADEAALFDYENGRLKNRTEILSRLKSLKTADQFMAGFSVYYNYLLPSDNGVGKTPADIAGLSYNTRSWPDVSRAADPDILNLVVPTGLSLPGDKSSVRTSVGKQHRRSASKEVFTHMS